MISVQLTDEAYRLVAEYKLGELVRIYAPNKRKDLQDLGGAFILTFIVLMAIFSVITGFHFIDGRSVNIIRWEQIEKVIYRKHSIVFSPPLCILYLTNGEELAISGYIHKRDIIKQAFDEHIKNKVQIPPR